MNGLFYGLLALLAWAPLPLGSNRTWAWTIMVIAACLLAMIWIAGYLRGRLQLTEAFVRALGACGAGTLVALDRPARPCPAGGMGTLGFAQSPRDARSGGCRIGASAPDHADT